MAHWRDEYLAALTARDRSEKANIALYNAYTRLADRTGRMTTAASLPAESQQATSPQGPSKKNTLGEPGPSLQESLAATRADLSEAQRSRSDLQDKLDRVSVDLEKLRKRNAQDVRRMNTLENQKAQLQLRLKDKDEERKGKAKLLDDVQDELATLNLQLNMAEDKSNRLQRENQELVDRWMARMGKEAEAMNNASKFS